VREAARERAEREEGQAGEEDPLATEQVGHAAAEQQESAEGDRVGGDHPLHALLGDAQVLLDRRDRDVHDRDVEDGHEERRADDPEDQPAARIRLSDYVGHRVPPLWLNSFAIKTNGTRSKRQLFQRRAKEDARPGDH
jgi:hypothetical protein